MDLLTDENNDKMSYVNVADNRSNAQAKKPPPQKPLGQSWSDEGRYENTSAARTLMAGN